MPKSSPSPSSPENPLQDVHARMVNLPVNFREKVCEECAWSIPTFYRKMRSVKVSPTKDKITPALSNAEKEKIIAVMDEVYQNFWDYCDKYRRKPGK